MKVIRQNQDIRNMHSQKMGMRFSITLLSRPTSLRCDSHTGEKNH